MNLDKKLYTLKYSPDTESHLKPDFEQCKLCITKCCVNICPAQVYEWNEETQELIVNFENCLRAPMSQLAIPERHKRRHLQTRLGPRRTGYSATNYLNTTPIIQLRSGKYSYQQLR